MRYQREKSSDWVEISGAAEYEVRELNTLWGASIQATQEIVTAVVKECAFSNRKGEPVDPRADWQRLTLRQWHWLRDQIIKAAAIDEVCDPEA